MVAVVNSMLMAPTEMPNDLLSVSKTKENIQKPDFK